ncbi:MAG: VanW family protein [Patescibacteria group bacterium]
MKKEYKIMTGVFVLFIVGTVFYFDLLSDFSKSVSGVSQVAKVWTYDGLKEDASVGVNLNVEQTLLGKAEVSYAGGIINRNHNIEIGIAKINGTVIHPGEEFSFLKTLGPVLESDGFREAKSFYMGEVILGLGGGLCHVSTTLFQSLLVAGLPITERHNHTFTVPYYRMGLDATISSVGPDLKFINDTGNDITIKGYTTKEKVAVFEIYGVNDERESIISEPDYIEYKEPPATRFLPSRELPVGEKKCENSRQAGFSVKRFYEVIYKDGTNKVSEFVSKYKPLGLTCYIGVDDKTDFTGCTVKTIYSPKTGVKCPTSF